MSDISGPTRVTVSSPRTRARRVVRRWPVARDLDEQTELGVIYVRSLVRAQQRVAVLTCAGVAAVTGGLPAAFALVPALSAARVLGIPLPWLLLALCVQPVWIGAAAWHVRQAERTERDFAELVEGT